MLAPSIGTLQLPDHSPARPVSSFATPNQSDETNTSSVHAWDDKDGPSFSDVLDVINPLQHIPIINTIYRHLTGDNEGAVADVAGGTLYGGFIGLGLAAAGLTIEDSVGEAPSDYVYARLFGGDDENAATAIAKNNAKPAETITEDDAPPPPNAAPREAVSAAAAPGNGPVQAGDYLVFGGSSAGSTRPQATAAAAPTPPATSVQPAAQTASRTMASTNTPAAKQMQSSPASDIVAARQGDYLVFGGSTPSAALPVPAQTAAVPQSAPAQSVTVTADATADASPIQNTLQQSAKKDGHLMPLPARRAPSVPSATLPQPTTGPGALPGGKSQAKPWTGSQANSAPTNDWFADAFNQNMNKYDSMHAASSYGAAAQTGAAAASAPLN